MGKFEKKFSVCQISTAPPPSSLFSIQLSMYNLILRIEVKSEKKGCSCLQWRVFECGLITTNQPSLGDTALPIKSIMHTEKNMNKSTIHKKIIHETQFYTEKTCMLMLDMFLLHYLSKRCNGVISSGLMYYHALSSNIRPPFYCPVAVPTSAVYLKKNLLPQCFQLLYTLL